MGTLFVKYNITHDCHNFARWNRARTALLAHRCPHGIKCRRFFNVVNRHEELACTQCNAIRDEMFTRPPTAADAAPPQEENPMAIQLPIELGDVARDEITGFEGVVIAETRWLHGCRRLTLQPRQMKDSKPLEPMSFDEPQCTLVSRRTVARTAPAVPSAAPKREPVQTGGPTPEPVQHPSVSQH